jgi:MFS family permease
MPPGTGAVLGQIIVGLMCDRLGRKFALIGTTLMIILGATLGTAAHGAHGSAKGLFWFLTFARGITGIVSAFSCLFLAGIYDWRILGCGWRVSCFLDQCERGCEREDDQEPRTW